MRVGVRMPSLMCLWVRPVGQARGSGPWVRLVGEGSRLTPRLAPDGDRPRHDREIGSTWQGQAGRVSHRWW